MLVATKVINAVGRPLGEMLTTEHVYSLMSKRIGGHFRFAEQHLLPLSFEDPFALEPEPVRILDMLVERGQYGHLILVFEGDADRLKNLRGFHPIASAR